MNTIDLLCGTHIDDAAKQLVANAPSRAEFNDITIRARYATTKPADIVSRFHRLQDERVYAYRMSPKGKAQAALDAADVAAKQVTVDRMICELPDFSEPSAVLAWVDAFVWAADRVGVTFDRGALVASFAAGGWLPGDHCGENFDGDDARNFAGWIVGQVLDGYQRIGAVPGIVHKFISDWREKFAEPSK